MVEIRVDCVRLNRNILRFVLSIDMNGVDEMLLLSGMLQPLDVFLPKLLFTVTRESQVSRAAFTFTVNHM